MERLQKIIAHSGHASRRKAEQLIKEGRVKINGKVVTELGIKCDPKKDYIRVDGKLIKTKQSFIYIMLHKPPNVVSTTSDPQGRPTVLDYVRTIRGRLYPVGRLDFASEGLMLLTNDGTYANHILHPSKKVLKYYEAKIKGEVPKKMIEKIAKGIKLEDGYFKPDRIRLLKKTSKNTWVEVAICEGKKHIVRRFFAARGMQVTKLKRIGIGTLKLGTLPKGKIKKLSALEAQKAYKSTR